MQSKYTLMAKIIQDFWLQQHANKRLHLLGWKGLFVLQKHLQETYLQVIIFIYYLFSNWVDTNFLKLFICGTPAVSLYLCSTFSISVFPYFEYFFNGEADIKFKSF